MKINNNRKKIKTIDDLFDNIGGTIHVAALLDVHQTAVEKWKKIGIPTKYWKRLMEHTGLNPSDLYFISQTAEKYAK